MCNSMPSQDIIDYIFQSRVSKYMKCVRVDAVSKIQSHMIIIWQTYNDDLG